MRNVLFLRILCYYHIILKIAFSLTSLHNRPHKLIVSGDIQKQNGHERSERKHQSFPIPSYDSPKLCLYSSKLNQESVLEFPPWWVTREGLELLLLNAPDDDVKTKTPQSSLCSDATFYDEDPNQCYEITPKFYRINLRYLLSERLTLHVTDFLQNSNGCKTHGSASMSEDFGNITGRAEVAINRTLQWCSGFVKKLNLCPWAKLSLNTQNAIRIKIIKQSAGLGAMEYLVRQGAQELIDITENGEVDPNVGITFVVALPVERLELGGDSIYDEHGAKPINHLLGDHEWDFEFEQFYQFCIDFEDQLLDEAEDQTTFNKIGDLVTIAPFHPYFSFASDEFIRAEKDDSQIFDPLDYEKRSPYPMISIVRSSAISQAGEEATSHISVHNEKILKQFGYSELESLYYNVILKGSE